MSEAKVELIRYIFLDVVGFTQGRSVEAQADIVDVLNSIVTASVIGTDRSDIIFIPTGDGMAICIRRAAAYDIHLRIALKILNAVKVQNEATNDPMRQFFVRIGISENSDNLVTDINGNLNVAGGGINLAARVMALADANQILVSSAVHDVLSVREKYIKAFRKYSAEIKHGYALNVYQYIQKGEPGLSTIGVSSLMPQRRVRERLSEYEAFYLGYGLKNRDFFVRSSGLGQNSYAAAILLDRLAKDGVGMLNQSELSPYKKTIHGGGDLSIEESFKYYMSIDFWLACDCAAGVLRSLSNIQEFFEQHKYGSVLFVASGKALPVIVSEQPTVASVLGLSESPA